MSNLIERHRRACDGFARVAGAVPSEKWDRPTPCTDWDARALVEHVIGFHEVLLLRPMGVHAHRPRTDPAARWAATQRALFDALTEPVDVLGALTTDVLVHTWDLARATGLDEHLDAELVHGLLEGMEPLDDLLRSSGQYGPRVAVPDDADEQTRLIAFTGRRP
jgi:uncharacterized protein (TIGR03083 family)